MTTIVHSNGYSNGSLSEAGSTEPKQAKQKHWSCSKRQHEHGRRDGGAPQLNRLMRCSSTRARASLAQGGGGRSSHMSFHTSTKWLLAS